MVQKIICRHGEEVLVDDEHYHMLNAREWKLDREGYPKASIQGVTTRMHNVICPPRPGYDVDHKNENKLDNRLENLEYLTKVEHTQKSMRTRAERNPGGRLKQQIEYGYLDPAEVAEAARRMLKGEG